MRGHRNAQKPKDRCIPFDGRKNDFLRTFSEHFFLFFPNAAVLDRSSLLTHHIPAPTQSLPTCFQRLGRAFPDPPLCALLFLNPVCLPLPLVRVAFGSPLDETDPGQAPGSTFLLERPQRVTIPNSTTRTARPTKRKKIKGRAMI